MNLGHHPVIYFSLLFLPFSAQFFSQSDVVIKTLSGRVRGTTKLAPNGKLVDTWASIPYAKPPVNRLRFRRPQLKEPWIGIRDVTAPPKPCWQKIRPSDYLGTAIRDENTELSEDCLYLTITVPRPRTKNLPVLVWFHGGSFTTGATTLELYNPTILASEENVVVVTVQYRLAAFGFSYFDPEEAPGNMGLYDQAMALFWVRYNIAAFGGNPQKITIFGESAGGASVSTHVLSPVSTLFFNQAIMQSGTATAPWATMPKENNLKQGLVLAQRVGCDTTGKIASVIECLRNVEPSKLISEEPTVPLGSSAPFAPIVDGILLPANPLILTVVKPYLKRINILLGTTSQEGLLFIHEPLNNILPNPTKEQYYGAVALLTASFSPEIREAILTEYTDQLDPASLLETLDKIVGDSQFTCPTNFFARSFSQGGNAVYQYLFTHRPSVALWPQWMGPIHSAEVPFVFGLPLDPSKGFKAEETDFSRRMMRLWGNFARTGNPNKSPNTLDIHDYWPKFDSLNRHYKIFAPGNYEIGMDLRGKKCKLWEDIATKLLRSGRSAFNNEPLTVKCPSDGVAVIPNPLRCDTFYVCVRGLLKLKTCPSGMSFDEELGTCRNHDLVSCGTRPHAPVSGVPVQADIQENQFYKNEGTNSISDSSLYNTLYWQPPVEAVHGVNTIDKPFSIDVVLERTRPYFRSEGNLTRQEGRRSRNIVDIDLNYVHPLMGKLTIERPMPILDPVYLSSPEKIHTRPAAQVIPVTVPVKVERLNVLEEHDHLVLKKDDLEADLSLENLMTRKTMPTIDGDSQKGDAQLICDEANCLLPTLVPHTTFVLGKRHRDSRSDDPWLGSLFFTSQFPGDDNDLLEEKTTSFRSCKNYTSSESCDKTRENLVLMYNQLYCCVKEELSWAPVIGSKRTNDQKEVLSDDFWSFARTFTECKSLLNTTCPAHSTVVTYDGEDICCPLIEEEEEFGQNCYKLYDEECPELYQSLIYNGETICCGEETELLESRSETFDLDVKIKRTEKTKNGMTTETKKKVQMVQKCQVMEYFTPCPFGYSKMSYRSMGVCCSEPYRKTVMSTLDEEVDEDTGSRDVFEVNVQELKDYEELSSEGSIFRGLNGKCHVLSDGNCEERYRKVGPVCCKFGKHLESEEDIETELDDFIDDREKEHTGECERVDQCGRSKQPAASLVQEDERRTRRLKVSLQLIPGFLTGKFEEIQGRTEAKARFASTKNTGELVLSEDHLNVLRPYMTKARSFDVPVVMVSAEGGEEIKQFSIVNAEPDASVKIAEEQDYEGRRSDVKVSLGALVEVKASLVDAETVLENWLQIR